MLQLKNTITPLLVKALSSKCSTCGKTTSEIQKIIDYSDYCTENDPSNLNALLYLEKEFNAFLGLANISVITAMYHPELAATFTSTCLDIANLFKNENYLDLKHSTYQKIIDSVVYYTNGETGLIGDVAERDVLKLRLDAMQEYSNLSVMRFSTGFAQPEKLQFFKQVVTHNNMLDMLNFVAEMPDSISFNLFYRNKKNAKDKNPTYAFCLKTGNQVVVFSGINDSHHKNQPPFSYIGNLLKEPFFEISRLPVNGVFWLSSMFEMIASNNVKESNAELIFVPDFVLNQRDLLQATHAYASSIPNGTKFKTITPNDVDYRILEKHPELFNSLVIPESRKWIENAYKHLIPNEALNLFGTLEDEYKLVFKDMRIDKDYLDPPDKITLDSTYTILGHMDLSAYGKIEDLELRRLVIARENYIVYLNKILNEKTREFEFGSSPIGWLQNLAQRLDFIPNAQKAVQAIVERFDFEKMKPTGDMDGLFFGANVTITPYKIKEIQAGSSYVRFKISGTEKNPKQLSDVEKKWVKLRGDEKPFCVISGVAPSYAVLIELHNINQIVRFLGLEREEIPYPISEFIAAEFEIPDYWQRRKLRFDDFIPKTCFDEEPVYIEIPLSKTGVKLLRNQMVN